MSFDDKVLDSRLQIAERNYDYLRGQRFLMLYGSGFRFDYRLLQAYEDARMRYIQARKNKQQLQNLELGGES